MEFKNTAGPKSFRGFQSFKEFSSSVGMGLVCLALSYSGLSDIFGELPEQICYYSDSDVTCTTDFGIGSTWIVGFQALGLLGLGILGLYILKVVALKWKKRNVRDRNLFPSSYLEHVQDIDPNLGQAQTFSLSGNPLGSNQASNVALMKQGFWFLLIISMLALQFYDNKGIDWWEAVRVLALPVLISAVWIWSLLSKRIGRAELEIFKILAERKSVADIAIAENFLYISTVQLLWPRNSAAYKTYGNAVLQNRSAYFKIDLSKLDKISLMGDTIMMDSKTSSPGQFSLQVGDETFDVATSKHINEELAKKVFSPVD